VAKPLVIYHGDCADGFAAAWCFWRHFGDSVEYIKGVYQGRVPDVLDRDVYLVDFSYKYDTMKMILTFAKSVTMLDHHKTALDDLWPLEADGLIMSDCTNEKSGAMIAWNYMQQLTKKKETTPRMIAYIQDRDLWKFELPGSKEVSMFLFSHEYEFRQWDKLMKATKRDIEGFIKLGAILEKKHLKDIRELIRTAKRYINLGALEKVPTLNVPYTMASDAGSMMSEEEPFAITYYDTRDSRCFSLRSNKLNPNARDVSEIASQYGGGGHFYASGFKVGRDHELAKL